MASGRYRTIGVILVLFSIFVFSGCGGGNLLPFGGPSGSSKLRIKPESMSRFLSDLQLDTAYIRSGAIGCIAKGKSFRERIKDQKGRWTLTTVWVDNTDANILYVQTQRTATCPVCNGTGIRKTEVNLSVDFRCLKCKGSGKIEDYLEQRKYILSEEDLVDGGVLGGNPFASKQPDIGYRNVELSAQEEKYVSMLASSKGEERLEALRWLDTHYVSMNVFFHRIMPMLRKATWIEADEKRGVTLYQFKGDIDNNPDMAYYRIFVKKASGKVIKKMFVKKENLLKNPYSDHEGKVGDIEEKAKGVKHWLTDGWDDLLK